MLLPSQFKTTITSLLWFWLGPHVPIHDPFNGCPSCATAGAVEARHTRDNVKIKVNARTCVPFLGLAVQTKPTVGTFCVDAHYRCGSGGSQGPYIRSNTPLGIRMLRNNS